MRTCILLCAAALACGGAAKPNPTPCTEGASCTVTNPCRTGAISCSSGKAVCQESGNVADGTSCGTAMVCTAGACGFPAVCPGTEPGDIDAGVTLPVQPATACNLPSSFPASDPDALSPRPAAFDSRYGSYPIWIHQEWSNARTLRLGTSMFDHGTVAGGPVPNGGANYADLFYSEWGDLFGDGSLVQVQASWVVSNPKNQPGTLHLLQVGGAGVQVLGTTRIPGTTEPFIADFLGTGQAQILIPAYLDFDVINGQSYIATFDRAAKTFDLKPIGYPIGIHAPYLGDWFRNGTPAVLGANYVDSAGAEGPVLIARDGKGGMSFTPLDLPGHHNTSGAFGDLDGNGVKDVILGDSQYDPGGEMNDNAAWAFYGQCAGPRKAVRLPDPYFLSSAYDGLTTDFGVPPGRTAAQERTHQVRIRVIDLNRDGKPDIVIASTLWNDVTPFGVFQMLIQQPDGTFKDETASRLYNFDLRRQSAGHQFWFEDINGDGYPDLLTADQSLGGSDAATSCASESNEVLINDGEGHFLSVMRAGFCKWAPNPTYVQRFNPWVRKSDQKFGFVNVDPQHTSSTTANYVYAWATIKSPLSTGPGFINPANCGAPGFNEWYYLLHYPDAKAAVDSGQYGSGLAYYLAVGKARGDKSHAD